MPVSDCRALIVDLRCMQDENYRERGVGRHSLGLLQHARAQSRFAAAHRIIGLTDRALPPLQSETVALVDRVQETGYVADMAGCWFVQLSPMTHDPLFTGRLAASDLPLKASVVYDFIPFDFPERYLPDARRRLDYHIQLAWLSRYDLFMPISQFSADRLHTVLGVTAADVAVTGAPLDPRFERPSSASPQCDAATANDSADGRHVLVIGGGDWRKNVECVVRAHGACAAMGAAGVPLVVTGRYGTDELAALQQLHQAYGGHPGQLLVPGHVSEDELLRLYGEALCIVTASRAEGFSLPVIEAMAVAVPSVASRIPAHQELIEDDTLLFDPDDHASLAAILAQSLQPQWRRAVVARQIGVWPHFRTAEVAWRFWSAMEARADARAAGETPVALRSPSGSDAVSETTRPAAARRPRMALLSPMPPDRSGVADYTAACCVELGKQVDLHVFTATQNPLPIANTTIAPLSALPHLSPGFDRVIGVMGNSHFHQGIFELLMRYGGACICHDARLLGFYRVLLGEQRTRDVAERELKRALRPGELERWLGDEAHLEATFFVELADVSEPLMFHSQPSVQFVQDRFDRVATLLPFSIYRPLTEAMLDTQSRAMARSRIAVPSEEPLLVTFGFVQAAKGPEECVWAVELLHSWGIPAHLHFVGELAPGANSVEVLARSLGLEHHVVFQSGYVEERLYRDYLLGADAAIQLRAYGLGSLSGALLDCIAAGLPCVANEGLAEALGAPEYVARIPDRLSPVLLAQALETLLAARRPARWDAARHEFWDGHNFTVYAERLCAALGLSTTVPA